MVDKGHSLGLKVGWYLNGCACGEQEELNRNYNSLRSLGAHITWRYLGRKMCPRRRPDLSRESVAAFDHGESSRDNEKALRHFQNGKTDV